MEIINWTLKNIYQKFLKIEDELDLFSYHYNDVYIWERIRFQVFEEILIKLGIHNASTHKDNKKFNHVKFFIRNFKNIFFKNPFLKGGKDILIYGCSRRIKKSDGLYWDIYYDYILEKFFQNKFNYIEDGYEGRHFLPPKTQHIYYTDFLQLLKFFIKGVSLIIEFEKKMRIFKETELKIVQYFDVKVNVNKIAYDQYRNSKANKIIYKLLIKRLSPKLVFLDNSYGREDFIEACSDLRVTTIELQHGIITKYHMGYSFGLYKKRNFPDYLMVFGDYWKEACTYPISRDNIFSLGYPHLESYRRRYDLEKKKQILFISQWTIGETLFQLALDLRQILSDDTLIIYKLHPGEFKNLKENYSFPNNFSGFRVISDEIEIYKLMSESTWQVGVYSTALYEGLYFDCKTFIFNCTGWENAEDLILRGCALKVNSAADILANLNCPLFSNVNRSQQLFKKNWEDNFRTFLNKINSEINL